MIQIGREMAFKGDVSESRRQDEAKMARNRQNQKYCTKKFFEETESIETEPTTEAPLS